MDNYNIFAIILTDYVDIYKGGLGGFFLNKALKITHILLFIAKYNSA